MLVDLTPVIGEDEKWLNFLNKECPELSEMEKLDYIQSDKKFHEETGIYWESIMGFAETFFEETKDPDKFEFKNEFWFDEENKINSYGLADSINQVKEYFKKQINDPNNKYFITLSKIYQEKDNKYEGLRWHKWGPYIGELTRNSEYFNNEDFGPDFLGYIITFHCYKL